MDKQAIFEYVSKEIQEITKTDIKLKLTTELETIQMDSLHAILLINKIKAKYGLEDVKVSSFFQCETVDDILDVIIQYKNPL